MRVVILLIIVAFNFDAFAMGGTPKTCTNLRISLIQGDAFERFQRADHETIAMTIWPEGPEDMGQEDCPVTEDGIKIYARPVGSTNWQLSKTLYGTLGPVFRDFYTQLRYRNAYEIRAIATLEGGLMVESNILQTVYLCPPPTIHSVNTNNPKIASVNYSFYCPSAYGIKFQLIPTDALGQSFNRVIAGPTLLGTNHNNRTIEISVADGQHYRLESFVCYESCSGGSQSKRAKLNFNTPLILRSCEE